MNSMPLVSVIVPFLNSQRFIQEAIESVFAQTYENWELLLVDDGSTDGSAAIAKFYAEQYPEKVSYLRHADHENRGASAARNLGISNAKGEHIAFLDADDVYLPHKLERQVPILDSQPEAAMVYGATQYWYSWTGNSGDIQRDHIWKNFGVQADTLIKPTALLTVYLRDGGTLPCICSFLVRRQVIERIGGFEEAFPGLYDDQAFLCKLCLNEPVFVASEWLERYRQHPNSTCAIARKTGEHLSARLNFLNWLEEYLSKQGVEDTEVWQALKNALWQHQHPMLHRLKDGILRLMWRILQISKKKAREKLSAPVHSWLRTKWRGE